MDYACGCEVTGWMRTHSDVKRMSDGLTFTMKSTKDTKIFKTVFLPLRRRGRRDKTGKTFRFLIRHFRAGRNPLICVSVNWLPLDSRLRGSDERAQSQNCFSCLNFVTFVFFVLLC